MSKFVNRMVGRTPPEEEGGEGEEKVREAELVRDPAPPSPVVSRLAGYSAAEGPKQDEWRQAAPPVVADEDPVELATDYAKLGEHVTSVLETAMAEAAKITDDAREDARRVAERTRKEAAKAIETARRGADKVSAEAEQLRAKVEKESRETRQRANAYLAEKRQGAETEAAGIVTRAKREASEHMRAAQERRSALDKKVALTEERLRQRANAYLAEKRQGAETEASGIVTRAKREASEHIRAAQERRSALDKSVALTEERLRRLVGGLRDLAGRLEELLEGQAPVPTSDATDAAPSRSLEASLRPSAATQQSTERIT